jgi:hypothetical protein
LEERVLDFERNQVTHLAWSFWDVVFRQMALIGDRNRKGYLASAFGFFLVGDWRDRMVFEWFGDMYIWEGLKDTPTEKASKYMVYGLWNGLERVV